MQQNISIEIYKLANRREWKARNKTWRYRKTWYMTGSALQIPTGKNGYSKHVKGATGFPNGGNKIKLEPNCIISMKNNFR